MQERPYRSLPVLSNGLRHSWDVFGREDDRGTANLLSSAAVLGAAQSEIRTGERVNLSLPLNLPDPPYLSRAAYRHTVFDLAPNVQDDVIDNFYLQSSTQWDGLRHRQDPEFGFYAGVSREEAGPRGNRLGVDAWAQEGLIGRGVLADIEAYCHRNGRSYAPTVSEITITKTTDSASPGLFRRVA